MRLKKITLKKFKRFDDLTIDLGDNPKKIIALVGQNGCGKSSIFDAFEQILQNHVGVNSGVNELFYSKAHYDETPNPTYHKSSAISIINDQGNSNFSQDSFYVRTAYRYTPNLKLSSIQQTADPIMDPARPGYSANIDNRLNNNFARLHGSLINDFYSGSKTGDEVRAEFIDDINHRLSNVLDVRITSLGNVVEGKGQLFFEKGVAKNFPFENLSSGEKEVVDLLIDLTLKTKYFRNTIFCIDEPELHLNTGIQRKLIVEIEKLIPNDCQLWIATHSVGFLRALQEELASISQVFDFSEKDYFSTAAIIKPIKPSRSNWKRIFKTALDDLSELLAPKNIIYCEGRASPSAFGQEIGLDAQIYNHIFEDEYPDTLFVSAGGTDVIKNSELALTVLSKALNQVSLKILKDRDTRTQQERDDFCGDSNKKMLARREIENYLFDINIIQSYSAENQLQVDQNLLLELIGDSQTQDLKLKQNKIKDLLKFRGSLDDLKIALAGHIRVGTPVYEELKKCIF